MNVRHHGVWLWLLAAGCASPIVVHPPGSTPPSRALDVVEPALTRHRVLAEGIEVHATLWDAALLTAHDPQRPSSREALAAERERWRSTYLERTSFTVTLDIADRPPLPRKGDDDLADLSQWSFALQRDAGKPISAQSVELLGIERFPTHAGTYHRRVVARVHFAGTLHTPQSGTSSGATLQLWIRTHAQLGRRPALGTVMARRGAPLRWQVVSSTSSNLDI